MACINCTAVLVLLPGGVQLLKAALSCHVVVGAGGSCRGAAVSRSLLWPNPPPLSAHFPNYVSPIPPAHQPSAPSFFRGSSLVLFLVPGVARDGGGFLWRDECCCCPLVAPWSLCSLTSSGLQPTAQAAPAGKQGSHFI